MKDRCFLDTNILVYAHDITDKRKRKICQNLIYEAIRQDNGAISVQVLNEFIVTVTRKIKKPLEMEEVEKEVELLKILHIQELEYNLVISALSIHKENNISYWDSLIIAAARAAQCTILYSEDLNDGQNISGIKIVDPFIQLAQQKNT